jgi:hypothetical protein
LGCTPGALSKNFPCTSNTVYINTYCISNCVKYCTFTMAFPALSFNAAESIE